LTARLAAKPKQEMRTDNPARGIERAPKHKRERFSAPAEMARFGEALAGHKEQASANAIRLLLLTGARKSINAGEKIEQAIRELELDSTDPDTLRRLVREYIEQHLPRLNLKG